MAEKKKSRTLTLNTGEKFKVIGETEKYYLCEKTQFRKRNPAILSVSAAEPKQKREE